ncbi:hypothetical protein Daura_13885 [Dactylosporangium aurantiacum]|uniref:Uncharacterized protein n=1 Tax=Dactylosporangium aurantiacum TaxID=35754 RepID=A0A9Q9IPQ7_9ACTN|nr:hypothetical protein [Dactylosporangium aurantiacum]MDG6109816.1 hypothetical protein [Dactylosporangium aurantiacum]UWZ57154.1 hypothetical protein Daura_13885 [Dactylosporangium aurantiacum]
MGFDLGVGLFLCDDTGWPLPQRRRFLDDLDARLRRLGLPPHREPASVADIDPPLPPGTDPCLLGASMGAYSSHARRADRLDWLARHVAVRGTAPDLEPPYGPALYRAYDALTDRGAAFDHLLAACGQDVVILPRPLDLVLADRDGLLVSAHRLRAEAVALGYVLRAGDPAAGDSPVVDWTTGAPVTDRSFEGLTARIDDDADQLWAEEADLCRRLLRGAADVLRTGALGLTS